MKKTLLFLIVTITICSTAHAGGARFYAAGGGGGGGGDLKADGTVPLTADWDAGAYEITMESILLDEAAGDHEAAPTLSFDGGSTGFYKAGATSFTFSLNGVNHWGSTSGWAFLSKKANGGAIFDGTPSATSPAFAFALDPNTGAGTAGADIYNIIAGGVNGIQVAENAGTVTVTFPNGYTRHIQMPAGAAALGPSAPTPTTTGTARGFGCDADGEELFFNVEVPPDWNTSSDMTAEIWWSSESGDAIADTEKVKWDVNYYSIADGEAVDNGTPVEITATYTQSGGGTDKEYFKTEITVDYDHADQPLAADDTLFMVLNRDVTGEAGDSYSGLAIVYRVELKYVADKMPYQ